VQPYLLAFKGVVPEYPQVPTKETPFDQSFYANTNVVNNCYPAASDIISGVSQTEDFLSVRSPQNWQGWFLLCTCIIRCKVCAQIFVLICCQAMFTGAGMPLTLYKELFARFGSSWAGQLVVDLSPERSKIGEAALS